VSVISQPPFIFSRKAFKPQPRTPKAFDFDFLKKIRPEKNREIFPLFIR